MKIYSVSPEGEKVEIADKPSPIRAIAPMSSKEKLNKIFSLTISHIGDKKSLIDRIQSVIKS